MNDEPLMEILNDDSEDADEQDVKIPDVLPVLPLPEVVVFPYMIVPLFVTRAQSAQAVDASLAGNRMVLLVSQRDREIEEPTPEDLHPFGTVALIMRMLKLPDGRVRILVQGFARAHAEYLPQEGSFIEARVFPEQEEESIPESLELEALVRSIKALLERVIAMGKNISQDVAIIAANLDDPGRLADLVASNLDLRVDDAQHILELTDPVERLRHVNGLMAKELEVLQIQHDISTQAKGEIDRTQREYYLRQQMKAIQQELGEGNELLEEVAQYREKVRESGMGEEASEEAERQIGRLERMHPDSAETATIRNYLDSIVGLPWSKSSDDNLNLKKAQKILDQDHYGLKKIKERIIEHLAVRKLKKDSKGPILCFVGPPGVGKTSLGRSIARALGRKFVRLSLGGVHDEAEIRGHRRTYVGAMPGRIIQSIQQAGTNNPVFMMDEVDKIGADFRGDPSSALLEVLDPEQNFAFRDNFLTVPFDLSNVMFITTANMLDPIQPAFRDRMEIIMLSGYTEEEKVSIAKTHLIPKQLNEHGLTPARLGFGDPAIRHIISGYTKEAGLRNLERQIGGVCRKVARNVAVGKMAKVHVTVKKVEGFLGRPKVFQEELLKKDQVGVSTGLAWTPVGGDILFVEATAMKGKGTLTLTGQLGDVMRESAQAAMSYARSRADELGIAGDFFATHDIHVHVPEGAIPKDGPSAGVTMATSIISLLTNKPVHRNIAMTGEITLRGEVLPVGGIKEKVLAARRAGIRTIILPRPNERDLEDINKELRRDVRFVFADNVKDVLNTAIMFSKIPAKPKTKKTTNKRTKRTKQTNRKR
jgi:ATP-dependent Lon protease